MNSRPLVSIVTPSYNQAEYLEAAIQSVLTQDYSNVEYILIDGGSSDGSQEIVQRYSEHLAYWVSEPDQGQVDAINKGLRRSQGEVVAWLNSDDVYLPGALGEAIEALASNPEVSMVYGNGIMVDSQLKLLDRHTYPQVDVLDLLSFEVILQPSVFMRRSALETVGFLNPSYNYILDHELWVRMASQFPVLHIDRFWSLERTHAQAKTIAGAGGFVQEAFRLVDWAENSPDLRDKVQQNKRRIHGGLNVFAARRLIDAGQYKAAFSRIMKAFRYHPPTVMRYWYKVVQAGLSAIGLAGLFEIYRRTRRSLVYRGQYVHLDHPPTQGH